MESEGAQVAVSVPLFLKKLWKMVNDKEAEDIIGWNVTGDGFVIYDQLQFITRLLPQYFKHNNMASFIRQLNFYDFHKVAGIDKDEIHFSHNCFLKDLPETLVFIKRKCTSVKSKMANNVKEEELEDLLNGVKEIKTKHSLVDNELKLLKQENAALWNEINNLRINHSKQSKIINKLIHFLISYMHSHQNSLSKRTGSVSRKNIQKNLKTRPTLLEIDYHNSFKDQQRTTKQNSYTVTEPIDSVTYPNIETQNTSYVDPVESSLDEMIDEVTGEQEKLTQNLVKAKTLANLANNTFEKKDTRLGDARLRMGTSKANSLGNAKTNSLGTSKESLGLCTPSEFQNVPVSLKNSLNCDILENPLDSLGLHIDNIQVELNSLQDVLNNINSTELINFCNLMGCLEPDNSQEISTVEDLATISEAIKINEQMESPGSSASLGTTEYTSDQILTDELASLPMESNCLDEVQLTENNRSGGDQITAENLIPEVLVDQYFNTDF